MARHDPIDLDRKMRARFRSARQAGAIACIDVGAWKTGCLIARMAGESPRSAALSSASRVSAAGFGCVKSTGVGGAGILDMEEAGRAIRAALDAAEAMAGMKVDHAIATLSGMGLASDEVTGHARAAGPCITERDLACAFSNASWVPENPWRAVIHAIPVSWTLDGCFPITDPVGMLGDRLGVDIHLVSAARVSLRNLSHCVGRSQLELVSVMAAPYASALACLTEDEKRLGGACVDIGARSTGLAVFFQKRLVFTDVIPMGGAHVTDDIVASWGFPPEEAERIKTVHGGLVAVGADMAERVALVQGKAITRSALIGLMRPRVETLFEAVRRRLEAVSFHCLPCRQVVFTGGGSCLSGLPDLAQRVIGFPARVGKPMRLASSPSLATGEAFSALAGLASYAAYPDIEAVDYERGGTETGRLARFCQWWSENW